MSIEQIGQCHPFAKIAHREELRLGKDRTPKHQVEVRRNASNLVFRQ